MNAKDFKLVMKQLIREAVKETLPTLLDEYFDKRESLAATITESKKELSTPPPGISKKQSLKELFERNTTAPRPEKPMKKYSNNEVLNKILNETTPRSLEIGNYSPVVLSEALTSEVSGEIPIQAAEEQDNSSGIYSVLTKDYSEVMEAMEQKMKQKRGQV